MKNYFTLRIELCNLDKKNEKVEYRELYKELTKRNFHEFYIASGDQILLLPKGMYAIEENHQTNSEIIEKALDGLAAALMPFYPSEWKLKYSIMIHGPGQILSRNLEIQNKLQTQKVTR